MLDDICAFLARYLQCSRHQRTVLSLWILHTHCFAAARTTPYLAIQSARKLSGKTLCLRLLSLLSSHPILTSGYTAATLVKRIHSCPHQLPTFLLDESPATLGSRARSRNPKLRSILVSGFQPGIAYSDRSLDCTIFSPKAFASLGPLPESLADCSIPILLQPLHHPEQSNIQRFDLATAQQQAQPLVAALQSWSRKNISALKSAPACQRKDFPQRLTWRGQDLVEPLLHLADLVGGDYPARVREALLHVFDDPGRQQSATDVQLLRQIRLCFEHHRWPDGLPTSLILADLHSLPSRPWDIDGPLTDRSLARMLRRYDIRPRVFRKKSSSIASSTARGYLQEEFINVWHNLLDQPHQHPDPQPERYPDQQELDRQPAQQTQSQAKSALAAIQEPRANSQKPVSPNNHAACYAVTDGGKSPEISPGRREGSTINQSLGSSSDEPMTRACPRGELAQPKEPDDRGPRRARSLACGGGGDPIAYDPRIKGILDNPLNFYRQYPEQHKAELRRLIAEPHHWPRPADDQMPPDVIFTMPDGGRIPFTLVNRPPRKPPLSFPDHQTERWPVLLNDQERLQVAVARFYELHALDEARKADEREKKQTVAASHQAELSSAVY